MSDTKILFRKRDCIEFVDFDTIEESERLRRLAAEETGSDIEHMKHMYSLLEQADYFEAMKSDGIYVIAQYQDIDDTEISIFVGDAGLKDVFGAEKTVKVPIKNIRLVDKEKCNPA